MPKQINTCLCSRPLICTQVFNSRAFRDESEMHHSYQNNMSHNVNTETIQ